MKKILISCFLVLTLFGFELPQQRVQNGKSLVLELIAEDGVEFVEVLVGMERCRIYKNPNNEFKFYAFIPIDYYEKPAQKNFEVIYKQNGEMQKKQGNFIVEDANYKKETLNVDPSKVTFSQNDKKRVEEEREEVMKIYSSISEKNFLTTPFKNPMESVVTSEYGNARLYNGSFKSYHGGTDFRAPIGAPIQACNDGVVVLVKDRFISGGTILLDHGRGVYSSYFHMSRYDVKVGDEVKKGDTIGLSGNSGRVTGPHLHFGFRVNTKQVDPLDFMKSTNKMLSGENI